MARPRTKVNARTTKSIVSRYNKGEGFVSLSERYELGIPIIRRVLVGNKVTIRGRGRPALQT